MEDKTWGSLPTPKIYIELQGEFIDFNKEEEYLVCKFPVQSKYFNPMETTLGGIIDSYMDVTMGPLSWLLGERVVTKSFSAEKEEANTLFIIIKNVMTEKILILINLVI